MSTKTLISQNIIAMLGIEALPDAEKLQLIERIASTIEKAVFLRVYDVLSEEQQDALTTALTTGNMMAVETVIASADIDLPAVVAAETKKITEQLSAAVHTNA